MYIYQENINKISYIWVKECGSKKQIYKRSPQKTLHRNYAWSIVFVYAYVYVNWLLQLKDVWKDETRIFMEGKPPLVPWLMVG